MLGASTQTDQPSATGSIEVLGVSCIAYNMIDRIRRILLETEHDICSLLTSNRMPESVFGTLLPTERRADQASADHPAPPSPIGAAPATSQTELPSNSNFNAYQSSRNGTSRPPYAMPSIPPLLPTQSSLLLTQQPCLPAGYQKATLPDLVYQTGEATPSLTTTCQTGEATLSSATTCQTGEATPSLTTTCQTGEAAPSSTCQHRETKRRCCGDIRAKQWKVSTCAEPIIKVKKEDISDNGSISVVDTKEEDATSAPPNHKEATRGGIPAPGTDVCLTREGIPAPDTAVCLTRGEIPVPGTDVCLKRGEIPAPGTAVCLRNVVPVQEAGTVPAPPGGAVTSHYHCDKCKAEFSCQERLARHLAMVHQARTAEPGTITTNSPAMAGLHQCVICNQTFNNSTSLREHQLGHHRTNPANMNFGLICKICGKCCCDEASLELHTKKHTVNKDYRCPVCYKGFSLKGSLSQHLLGIHDVKKVGTRSAPKASSTKVTSDPSTTSKTSAR